MRRPAELTVGRLLQGRLIHKRAQARIGAALQEQGDELRLVAARRLLQRGEAVGPACVDRHAEIEQERHGLAASVGRPSPEDGRLGRPQQPGGVGMLGRDAPGGDAVAGETGAQQLVERLGSTSRAELGEQLGQVGPTAAHGDAVRRAARAIEGRLEVGALLHEQPHHLRRRLAAHGPLQRVLALAPLPRAALEQHPGRAHAAALARRGRGPSRHGPARRRRAGAPGRPGPRRRRRRAASARRRDRRRPPAACARRPGARRCARRGRPSG